MAVSFKYMENTTSGWTGSVNTAEQVKKQICARWGTEEADKYDPKSNCLTFMAWLKAGYAVRKGEKAIKSFIMLEEKDKDNKVVRKHFKRISLFYIRQVDKLE